MMLTNKIRLFSFLVLFVFVIYSPGCTKKSDFEKKEKPEVLIEGDDLRLKSNILHFYKDTVYVLTTDLQRDSGQVLLIDAGTLIKINNKLSISINPGSTIEAKGTSTEPIIFTSAAPKGGAGIGTGSFGSQRWWYGIRIYGNSLTNPSMGSGFISYVRIEFAGGNENFLNLPSLLFKNVTNKTAIDNIQVSYSFNTPSFEFSGGNCNASNLISYASGSTDFYLRNGFNGMLQSMLAYRHPYFPSFPASFFPSQQLAGLLISGNSTFPTISNLTVAGPDLQKGTSVIYLDTISTGTFGAIQGRRVASLIATDGSRFRIRNSVLFSFPKGGFYLDDRNTALSLNNGESDFSYSIVHSNDSSRAFYLPGNLFPGINSKDFRKLMLEPQFGNKIFFNLSEFGLSDPFNYDEAPNPVPSSGSLLLNGSNFDGPVFGNSFFKKVTFRGALGTDNWLQFWTNFIPLQTNYNN